MDHTLDIEEVNHGTGIASGVRISGLFRHSILNFGVGIDERRLFRIVGMVDNCAEG